MTSRIHRDIGSKLVLIPADGGIIAGVCVAFIATIADRMINAWAAKRKREYGFE
jgi:glycine betaine/proline transport system permease protein